MRRLVIINGKLILPDGIVSGKVIVCRGGRIDSIMSENDYFSRMSASPSGCACNEDEIIDAGGKYVSPGFIDIHIHGGGGYDFMDGTVEAFLGVARTHARYGTTSMAPTTLTCTDEELFETFRIYKEACKKNSEGARFLGLHLEGPYFSPKQAGAQDPSYLKKPVPEHYNAIFAATDDIIRWSVAPEIEGAIEFGRVLKGKGILASVAHTDAVYEDVEKAYEAGYTHATHLYCAMSSVTRRNAFRYAGAVEAAYLLDGFTVEIIADGVHLPAPLLRFVYKFKGPGKTALCTDAMRAAGMPDGEYILGSLKNGQKVIVEDGVAKLPDRTAFAGSVATTDRLVRTMMNMAGVPLEDAVRMMTATPAQILGVYDRIGSLEVGKDADIIIFDGNIKVQKTISKGYVIYEEGLSDGQNL